MHIHLHNRIRRFVLHHKRIAHFVSKYYLHIYLVMVYEEWLGKRMSMKHPSDLNQAMLRLSYQNSKNPSMRQLIPQCVDKYAVREYITAKGYSDTLNELYGVYDNVDDIDFEALPDQFVMKMNNASGRNWICTDKSAVDWLSMKRQFAEWLNDNNFGWETGEWQYALIKPRIIVEKYLAILGENSLIDYKFQCFHGEPKSCFVGYDRDPLDPHGKVNFDDYDMDWHRTERILPEWHLNRRLLPKPKCWTKMIQMASDIGKDFTYVRFDVYEVNGRILFGEMTFTPQGCIQGFYSEEYLIQAKEWL